MSHGGNTQESNLFGTQEPQLHQQEMLQGLIEHRRGRFDLAERYFRKLVSADESVAVYHSYLGCALRCQGKLDDAAASYSRALERRPDYPEALYFLGVVLQRQGKLPEAMASFKRSVELRPGYADALLQLGLTLRLLGQLEAAVEAHRRMLELRPNDIEALFCLGVTLQNLDRWKEAETCFTRLLDIQPDHIEAQFYMGMSQQHMDRWEEAAASFSRFLSVQPDHTEALFQLGFALQNLQLWEEAAVRLRQAVRAKPDYAQAFLLLGDICNQIGRWEEAVTSYARAAELVPQLKPQIEPRYRTKVNYDSFPTNCRLESVSIDFERFSRQILNNLHGLPAPYPATTLGGDRKTILLAAMPKSASTFLITCLSNLLELPHVPLSFHFERSEQDLYLPSLLYFASVDTLSQHHLRATDANMRLINLFSIKTILLVRNIFDAVVSLRDHFMVEGPIFMGCHVDESFPAMDKQAQYDMLVDLATPWFIHFYVSWYRAVRNRRVNVFWLTYEDLITDPVVRIGEICSFVGISKATMEIDKEIAKSLRQKVRLNVGKSGRGVSELGQARINQVMRMSSYYPDVDFSRIGIVR